MNENYTKGRFHNEVQSNSEMVYHIGLMTFKLKAF